MSQSAVKSIKINSKIVSFKVKKDSEDIINKEPEVKEPVVSFLDKHLPKRGNGPLIGETFKVKDPTKDEPSIYCTVNFRLVDGKFRLAELFTFSKRSNSGTKWERLSTRVISALALRTGRIGFLIDSMKEDSEGNGYRVYIDDNDVKPTYVLSIVAHMGHCIERACQHFNVMDKFGNVIEHDDNVKVNFKIGFSGKGTSDTIVEPHLESPIIDDESESLNSVVNIGRECSKCHEMAVRNIDGCETCTNCGDSKCG